MIIERSSDRGLTWKPYQYFAYDCSDSFPERWILAYIMLVVARLILTVKHRFVPANRVTLVTDMIVALTIIGEMLPCREVNVVVVNAAEMWTLANRALVM